MFNKSQPRLLDVNKKPGQPKRRKKITLVFDEEKRREFLGGFRKRKLERKRKAQEQLQQQLKEERKKIKEEVRERYKKSLSQQNIPELEQLLSKKEYKLENHTVSILELNIADLKEGSAWIGQNKIAEENEEKHEDNKSKYVNDDNDKIVGMSLRKKQIIAKDVAQDSKSNNQEVKSSKELKREMRKIALKRVKKSKAFQQKQRLEQQKNRKRSKQKLHKKTQKLAHKSGKRNKKKSTH